MKKIGKTSALAAAAVLAVSGIAAAAAPASAATGPPSAACAAATAAYNQDQSAFKTLQDQLSSAENSPSILPDTSDQAIVAEHNELEGEEEDAIQAVDNAKEFAAEEFAELSHSNPFGENGHLDPTVYLELGTILGRVTSADIALAYVESQLSALNDQYENAVSALNTYNEQLDALNAALSSLKGRAAAAQAAAQAAQEAEASACQGMTTPTATPTTPAATPTATPSGTSSGSTQQYYHNGALWVLLDAGIIVTVGSGESIQADCAETAADPGADNTGNSGAGQAGNYPEDTGPTVADQTAWISGCVAQENAYPVSVLSPVTPAATTPAATTPAATTPAATTPAATTPAATPPAATPGRV
jgi:hypothetical protein